MNEQKFLEQTDVATVFLINGVKLQGKIISQNEFEIYLEREGVVQMAYKHSISTVLPNEQSLFWFDEE